MQEYSPVSTSINQKNKKMKQKLWCAILFLATSTFASAQSFVLKTWDWDDYKMEFRAPDNMVIEQNDGDGFKASNQLITLDIYPRKGENLSYDGMKNAISRWAGQTNLDYNDVNVDGNQQPFYLSNLNGYWGVAIDGKKDGFPASMLLLVDPDYPDISFYVWISYSSEYYDDAVAILKSFKPI